METDEAKPEAQEEDKAMAVDPSDQEEAAGKAAGEEEKPAVQSSADEKPPEEMAVDEAATVKEVEEEATCGDEGGLPIIKDEHAGSEMQDDPVVVVDNLGEFGVSLSDTEQNGAEEERPPETFEPKVVVKGTGGIVMKVKAESIQAPASPVPPAAHSTATEASDAGEGGTEPTPAPDESTSDGEEFRPPTPDPRFQSLPPVQRGNELSGLCCIM
ncbi:hypothetical protein V5799_006029 [Amblyomma americanum]|uniref:Uncharacterized protein n=1 Tax=Amblyomma americanum TaxID=6943 RepID=A0AAQ4DXK1_AMBAM